VVVTLADYLGIRENLDRVQERIQVSAARVGRDPRDIELVAITKGHSVNAIQALLETGQRLIGENRVGEALKKQRDLGPVEGLAWDMVGHIQSRKARDVIGRFDRVHSIDRMKIAKALARLAGESSLEVPVLIECNVSGEDSKYGFAMEEEEDWQGKLDQIREICELEGLDVQGLMTMAPWTEDPSILRATFSKLRKLKEYLLAHIDSFEGTELSMGMTDDFEIAIEEGSTIVRLGRAILGERSG
jgi:pyridoxal phosphate enzyme (YggS family)